MKRLLTYIMTMCIVFTAFSQHTADSVKIYFRLGNSQLDLSLRDNREAMTKFIREVHDAVETDNIERIVVRAYASPDGSSNMNAELCKKRCNTITNYLIENTDVNIDIIQEIPSGIAWKELRDLVVADTDVPYREKILYILDNTPVWVFDANGKIIDGRKKQLMDLAGGNPYKWLCTYLFPELRNAVAIVIFLKSDPYQLSHLQDKAVNTQLSAETIPPEIICSDDILPEEVIENPFSPADSTTYDLTDRSDLDDISARSDTHTHPANRRFAVRTNMLYDAALIPNIGFEFFTGKHISVYGEWMYAWWDKNARHRFWCTYGGNLGARWWLGRNSESNPFTGHHIGIYAGVLIFDFELGGTGYMGGKPGATLWERFLVNSGIEYGYSLPIGRRLNIDFSIGLGYLGGNYIKYFPFDNDYYRDKEYKLRFFGPTKAEISLVWLLGQGNSSKRKGGKK